MPDFRDQKEAGLIPEGSSEAKFWVCSNFATMSWWEERPINSPKPTQPTTNGVSFTQLRTWH